MDDARSNYLLLRDQNFAPWFIGNLTSNSGNWLFNVTASVVVYDLGGIALLVGFVSVAQFVPLFMISPIAGSLSDRYDRRRILIVGQSIAATAALLLAFPAILLGVDRLPGAWPVLAAALGIGIGKAVSQPAAKSLVPAIVPDADLEAAISLTALTFMIGRAAGPLGAGVLLATLGPEVAFLLNGLSFVTLIVALQFVQPRERERSLKVGHSVREGFRYVLNDRAMVLLLSATAATGIASDPVLTLTPPLAAVLGGSNTLVAAMVSGFGLAATLSAPVSGWFQRRSPALVVGAWGMAIMAGGLGMTALATSPSVAVLGFAFNGAGYVLAVTSLTTVVQRRVPDHFRGRVMALWTVAVLGIRPLAALIDGGASDLFGPRIAMSIGIATCIIGMSMTLRVRNHMSISPT